MRYDAVAAGGPAATMKSPDAPLVAPGDTDHLLHYDGYSQPNLDNGWHFNLHNNAWGERACTESACCAARDVMLILPEAACCVSQANARPSSCHPPPATCSGTAFPQWYDDDGYFRFTLELQAPHGAVKTQANM